MQKEFINNIHTINDKSNNIECIQTGTIECIKITHIANIECISCGVVKLCNTITGHCEECLKMYCVVCNQSDNYLQSTRQIKDLSSVYSSLTCKEHEFDICEHFTHQHCSGIKTKCCVCADSTKMKKYYHQYPKYVDGNQIENIGTRYEYYCPQCKKICEVIHDKNIKAEKFLSMNSEQKSNFINYILKSNFI